MKIAERTSFKTSRIWNAGSSAEPCDYLSQKISFRFCREEERYLLGDQMLRAARPTTANIADGYGRFHYLDNAKFCSNARGSCWEVLDHLITSSDENLLPPTIIEKGKALVHESVKLLNGYMNYLKRAASDNR